MVPFIEFIVRSLVDHPGGVSVTEVPEARWVTYEIRVSPEDVGQVVGKEGRIAHALRVLVGAVAKRGGLRARLDVLRDPPDRSAQ